MRSFIASEAEISSNARIKNYIGKSVLQVANAPIFHEAGYEAINGRGYDVPSKGNAADPERSLAVSRARAASAVRDIALCNPFSHFLTWTLDGKLIDRYDPSEVGRRLQTFLHNASSRKGFSYLCLPERHKDRAIHMHGLCCLGDVRIERARNAKTGKPLTQNGRPVYNMLDWKLGYSTCVPIDANYEKAVNYVVKYLNKADEKIFGKWYYSSRCLKKKPDIELVDGVDYTSFREAYPGLNEVPIYRDIVMCSLPLEQGVYA